MGIAAIIKWGSTYRHHTDSPKQIWLIANLHENSSIEGTSARPSSTRRRFTVRGIAAARLAEIDDQLARRRTSIYYGGVNAAAKCAVEGVCPRAPPLVASLGVMCHHCGGAVGCPLILPQTGAIPDWKCYDKERNSTLAPC